MGAARAVCGRWTQATRAQPRAGGKVLAGAAPTAPPTSPHLLSLGNSGGNLHCAHDAPPDPVGTAERGGEGKAFR